MTTRIHRLTLANGGGRMLSTLRFSENIAKTTTVRALKHSNFFPKQIWAGTYPENRMLLASTGADPELDFRRFWFETASLSRRQWYVWQKITDCNGFGQHQPAHILAHCKHFGSPGWHLVSCGRWYSPWSVPVRVDLTVSLFVSLLLCFDAIGPILLHIVNVCLTSCDFPDSWKNSVVHPIFKSGDPAVISNYRPISIVPIMAKVVERVVQRQLSAYMSDNHLLSHHNTVFVPTIQQKLLCSLSQTESFPTWTADTSPSYASWISVNVLMSFLTLSSSTKFELYGIDPTWFSSYLTGHTQSVCISSSSGHRAVSKPLPNTMGVFQGSALGPLLFTIFANDLSLHAPDAHVTQYADDTQVLISDVKRNLPNLILRMESTLTSLASWFHAHGLKLNTSKTEILLLGTRQNTRDLSPVSVRGRWRDRSGEPMC